MSSGEQAPTHRSKKPRSSTSDNEGAIDEGRDRGFEAEAGGIAEVAKAEATAAVPAPTDEGSKSKRYISSSPADDEEARQRAARHKGDRERVLGNLTLNEALEKFYRANERRAALNDPQTHPLRELSSAIGAVYERVAEFFYGKSDMQTKKRFAGILFKNMINGDFQECMVDVGPATEPLFENPPTGMGRGQPDHAAALPPRIIDMNFLKGLRMQGAEEQFLIPTTVYVRDCMRTIFSLFREDIGGRTRPEGSSTVLVGSPGVGTSILFFLAALCQAQTKMVVFCRIAKASGEPASVFVMNPEGDGKVCIWFSRNIDTSRIDRLSDLCRALERELHIRRDEYNLYVDGPRHTDEEYLVNVMYDYYCTSGGFPLCTGAGSGKRLWVLDGWTREEAVNGLLALAKPEISAAQAERAYWICGGSIRDMLEARVSPVTAIEERNRVVRLQGIESTEMAMFSSERSLDRSSPDSLRTMFRDPSGDNGDVMGAVQIVDSAHCLDELTKVMDVEAFLRSYELCLRYGMTAAACTFFKRMVHRAVMLAPQPPVSRVCRSGGDTEASVRQLKEAGVYWIPGVCDGGVVPVDAALVHNHALYSFQMSVAEEHEVDMASIRANFASAVKDAFKSHHTIKTLVLYVIVPMKSRPFNEKQLTVTYTDGMSKLDAAPGDIEVRIHPIDAKDPGTVSHSIEQLWGAILREPSRGAVPEEDSGRADDLPNEPCGDGKPTP